MGAGRIQICNWIRRYIEMEENMSGVGDGCPKSQQDGEDDALDILKSFLESDEVTSTSKNVPVDKNDCIDHFNSGLSLFHKLPNAEDQLAVKSGSVVHSGETDSSDDEYSDYGRALKKMLVEKREEFERDQVPAAHTSRWKGSAATISSAFHTKTFPQPPLDISMDSVFGIQVINCLVSSSLLKEKMQGREAVPLSRLKRHVAAGRASSDWVVAGVIIHKSCLKLSQKGTQYYVWKLSDLRENLKTFSLFLFRAAASEMWKLIEGTVIAVLNPSILDNKPSSGDEATLSVDSVQRVLILGTSKDFGVCRAMKNNGVRCTMFVNKSRCEFCVFHLKKEYHKCSRRAELSSPGSGLINIRNKVLGKNEVFYAGKCFTATPAKFNVRQHQKDKERLKSLSLNKRSNGSSIVALHSREKADAHRLLKLEKSGASSCSAQGNTANGTKLPPDTAEKLEPFPLTTRQSKQFSPHSSAMLGVAKVLVPDICHDAGSQIDLSVPASKLQREQAMINAKKWIKLHGQLKKLDPNSVRNDKVVSKKRKIGDSLGEGGIHISSSAHQDNKIGPVYNIGQSAAKLQDIFESSKFQELMKSTTKHTDLLEVDEVLAQDQYFEKLEKKEQLELKMLETYKVPTKAVHCRKCKYTAFGPSELCKSEMHTLKTVNTFKRFFRCGHCCNRTVTLDLIVPLEACRNCGESQWERAPMMKETQRNFAVESLSLRGDEEKFLGSLAQQSNLNLMVPDEVNTK